MQFTFKIGSKIKEAWVIYKENLSIFLLLALMTFIIKALGSKDNSLLTVITFFVGLVLSYIWIRFGLDLVDKKASDPFSQKALPTLKQYWNFLKTTVLVFLCILAGFILLIVPGLYVSGRLVFALYISVEKNQGARVTVKEAWEMTDGYGWKLFWKSVVIGLFMIVGFIAFFIGGFVTYPVGFIVFIIMYREFLKMKSMVSSTTSSVTPVSEIKQEEKVEPKEEVKEEAPQAVNH